MNFLGILLWTLYFITAILNLVVAIKKFRTEVLNKKSSSLTPPRK